MPDWISHLLITYITVNLLGIKKRKMVYVGALLPDAFKLFIPFSIISSIANNTLLNFFAPSHTVFGVILTGLFISSFFAKWRRTYALILLGASLHLTADIFLYPYGTDIWILYPLWMGDLGTGVLWSDGIIALGILLPISGGFYLKNRQR